MSNYKILSLDGGGIRGLLTVRLMERLTSRPGLERAFDGVDLIAGNSSGALIALAMAAERARQTPMKLALRNIRKIFEDGQTVFGDPRFFGFLLYAKYSGETRHRAFEKQAPDLRLRDLGTNVLITTFDLDNEGKTEELKRTLRSWKPKIFHSFKCADGSEPSNKQGKPDREQLAADVAWYSSAAPAFFPTANGYIDGGVYGNNPSMCALAQVLDERYEPVPKPPLEQITMFAVGAGRSGQIVEGDHDWGIVEWAWNGRYVNLATDATVGVADYECRQMLEDEHYARCDADLPGGESFSIDAIDRIAELRTIADAVDLDAHAEWLHRHWAPRPAMIAVPEPTSKHLLGSTELSCMMPIKPGFVDAFETHTYATRIRIVLGVLNALRQASREFVQVRVFPDVVDVIRSIHSFRLSILPDNKHLLLAVNFDRPWEAYMRIIWRELGAILDLILINCEGYELHTSGLGYEAFASYIRAHQLNTDLFYVGSTHTVDDVAYLTELETRVRRNGADPKFDVEAATLRITPPEVLAADAAGRHQDDVACQGLIALAAFYKLRELYLDAFADAGFLRAAVAATLKTFDPDTPLTPEQERDYARELEWFRTLKTDADEIPAREPDLSQVQSGIISPTRGRHRDQDQAKRQADKFTHGCLLLARIEDADKARPFLARLADQLTPHGAPLRDKRSINVAFTPQGLKRLGVSDAQLAAFPKEFREGMEARAGLLGDVGSNHPDNWKLPEWNWDGPDARPPAHRQVTRVHLATVDVVIQIRAVVDGGVTPRDYAWETHALNAVAHDVVGTAADTGIRVMSAQPMVNHRDSSGHAKGVEHFGFRDNISQPIFNPDAAQPRGDEVRLGEFLLGHENDRQDPPFFDRNDERAMPFRYRGGLLDNGTFLVIRKLEQDVHALYLCVDKFLRENPGCGLTFNEALGKLMGRQPNGCPVTAPNLPATNNDFDYKHDDGTGCPLHAHIRRANPRPLAAAVPRTAANRTDVPRIARRGMSYGPLWKDHPDAERGMMFLAYNASIAEQFEVIQRWMTAGNSTGEYSGRTDPFMRVPQTDRDDIFLIPHNGQVLRMHLGQEAFVSLRWGMYLFVPSIAAVRQLAEPARPDTAARAAEVVLGQRVIEALTTEEDWRAVLEDTTALSSGRTAAVCAAIRHQHGGAIRTPGHLVLVANEQLALQVMGDDRTFSVSEYRNRLCQSIGDIYLGRDSTDPQYAEWSQAPNEAISKVSECDAFVYAHATTEFVMREVRATHTGPSTDPIRLPLADVIDTVLAQLSAYWFGVPDGTESAPEAEIIAGGQPRDRDDTSVHCPFHTLAPSRYIFSSPRPRKMVEFLGQRFGSELHRKISRLAERKYPREWPKHLPPISQAVWETSARNRELPDFDLFASLLAGVMEGFLPTVYGNFLKTMHVWLTDRTLWRVQQDLLLRDLPSEEDTVRNNVIAGHVAPLFEPNREYARAKAVVRPQLVRAMQSRPVPDMVYRTATRRTWLGNVSVEPGERVVVLIGSVTRELAAAGRDDDPYAVFGGNRQQRNGPLPGMQPTFETLMPPPTHACPGYQMGMGVLLGSITAVLEAGPVAATTTPLVVNLTDRRAVPRRIRVIAAPQRTQRI